ncbi:MAG: hypothetical protein ACTHOU_11440, partial [Aureliella sp.]
GAGSPGSSGLPGSGGLTPNNLGTGNLGAAGQGMQSLDAPILQLDQGIAPGGGDGRLTPIPMESVRSPIVAANITVEEIGTRVLPEDEAAKQAAGVLPLPGGEERGLGYLVYRWQSANICHGPLYFEEPMLERHGQRICPPILQPAVSGGKFYTSVFLLPYKATLWPVGETRYTLGHFRPGSPAPLLKDTLPWSPRAAAVQGAFLTGAVVGLPW